MKRKLTLGMLVMCLLATTLTQAGNGAVWAVSSRSDVPTRPKAPLATLPVFQIAAPAVNQDTLLRLAGNLPGIGGNAVLSDTTFAGSLRLTSVNTQTGTSLQQFVATGGFFAANFRRAFSETMGLRLPGPSFVCNFMQNKGLFPQGFTSPDVTDCAGQLPYEQTPIYLSIVTPTIASSGANGPAATQAVSQVIQIGVVYRVPLAINVGMAGPNYIPLSGPGGHLSILLTGEGDQESLDPAYPGVNAIASPMNGRSIQRTIGNYPVVSQQEAIDQLRGVLPPGAVITPGNPGLTYYVDHPAVTQTVMMPMWVFTDALANVGGQEVDLKGLALPGVQGFLPGVQITSPADNTIYFPGQPLTVTGVISGTAGPFTYTLQVEGGSVLTTGVAPSGTLQLPLSSVPVPALKGSGDNVVLRLSVTDGNDAMSQDTTLLLLPLTVYLPVVLRDSSGSSALSLSGESTSNSSASPACGSFYDGRRVGSIL